MKENNFEKKIIIKHSEFQWIQKKTNFKTY